MGLGLELFGGGLALEGSSDPMETSLGSHPHHEDSSRNPDPCVLCLPALLGTGTFHHTGQETPVGPASSRFLWLCEPPRLCHPVPPNPALSSKA